MAFDVLVSGGVRCRHYPSMGIPSMWMQRISISQGWAITFEVSIFCQGY